jgi:predicted porin
MALARKSSTMSDSQQRATHGVFALAGLSALLFIPALAAAQAPAPSSVVIYGFVDGAATQVSDGITKTQQLTTSTSTPSRWGIRVREDLGGGLFATANLEMGISLDTGAQTLNRGWGRGATVGLGHAQYGQITLGRQLVPQALAMGPYSAMQAMGPGYWAILTGVIPLRSIFSDNAIVYQSPTWSGFQARAMVSSGYDAQAPGGIGDDGSGRQVGGSAAYTVGPFSAAVAVMSTRLGPAAGGGFRDFRDLGLAASYTAGTVRLFAGAYDADDRSIADDARRAVWLGAIVPFGQARVGAQVATRQDQRNAAPVQAGFAHTGIAGRGAEAKARIFGVFADYSLSRRSALYASYGRVNNDATAQLPLGSGDGPLAVRAASPGRDPSALSIGIRHAF